MLFNNLTEHLESEENHQRKCKMSKSDIDNFATRIASCIKVIEEETQQADNIKKDLEKLQLETEELKKKETDVKDLINRHKLQMNIIEKDCIKGLEEIEIRQENEENELKKKLDEQIKVREELQSKQISLMNQQKFGIEEISELQSKHSEINTRIDDLRDKIKEIESRDAKEKRNNDEKKTQLNQAKI
jgi:chromosome segregation ATPase